MEAIRYYRVSTTEQVDGTGLTRQRDLTNQVIRDRGWIALATEYVDEGRSATKAQHRAEGGALHRFEQEAREGQHHGRVLVVEKLDRLSRRGFRDTYELINTLLDLGVSVATSDGSFFQANVEAEIKDEVEILLRARLAREEMVTRGNRIRLAHSIRRAAAQSDGKALGKLCPAWLEVGPDDRYRVIEDRAALVRRMYQMADDGHGAQAIARKLNQEGVAVWQRWANRPIQHWDRTRIRKMLSDRAVLGWREGKGEPFLLYPPIVDADLFERVRAGAPGRLAAKGGAKSSVVANLFAALVECDVCGGPVSYLRKRTAGTPYITRPGGNPAILKHDDAVLMCRSANLHKCDQRDAIAYHGFERAVLDTVLMLALDDRSFSRSDELGALAREIAEMRQKADVAIEKAKNLWRSFAERPSQMVESLAREAEDEASGMAVKVKTLEAARRKAAGEASDAEHLSRVAAIRDRLHDDDLDVRRLHRKKVQAALHSVIDRIWIERGKVATVALKGGFGAFQIHRGKVINRVDLRQGLPDDDYSTLTDDPREQAAIAQMVERMHGAEAWATR